MIYVIDACALIAYLKGEPGAPVVDSLLSDHSNLCVTHGVNICEVYYDFERCADRSVAQAAVDSLLSAGVIKRDDMDMDFLQSVGHYKATIARVSLADCFCMALANRLGVEVVTSDHREFDPLANQGVCRVMFIR